jgi:FKBP-type peptidyl-prolyl cis-trans isomerase FkpA
MISTSKTRTTLLLALLVTALSSCTPEQREPGTETLLETEDDKTLYAMGVTMTRNLDRLPLSESEKEALQAGFADGIYKREPKVDTARYGRKVQGLFARRTAALAEQESEAAEAFLAEAAAMEGAERSDSGLVMQVLSPGDGPSPGPTDRVRVHYHGTLRDGTVFDSSVVRGEPAVFPLNRVVPCWTEALQKMKTGEKSRVTCPADIAYGDQGAPPLIKPGAALAFEVELLEILQ